VLSTITRLVHDLGMTVMMAEHRLERVVQYADRVVLVHADGLVEHGDPRATLAHATVVPPIVELGRACRWDPLPLSVRDARRDAAPLRAALDGITPPPACAPVSDEPRVGVLAARDIVVRYGPVIALRNVDIDLWAGEIVALMGRNGSGKSSLLWALHGAGPRASGSVTADGGVGLVPHTPSDVLYLESVGEELAQADREASVEPGTARACLDALVSTVADSTHPRDLSEGQRLALVLAIQLTENPTVVLLDEPTRGLDYDAKHALAGILCALAARGHAVMVSTHDVEFVAAATHRVVVLADGEIVADGPTADVVVASPAYAPQVAKILAPLPWLTVDQLARAGAFSLDGATP
jgi:energy-coupling factor transport system ATP-binding protein